MNSVRRGESERDRREERMKGVNSKVEKISGKKESKKKRKRVAGAWKLLLEKRRGEEIEQRIEKEMKERWEK